MKLMHKLQSRRGETMVEMLVSMMILTLTICLLVTMIVVSYQFDRQAREADNKFKEDLAAAENFTGAHTSGKIILKPDGGPSVEIDVEIYSKDGSDLKSYK